MKKRTLFIGIFTFIINYSFSQNTDNLSIEKKDNGTVGDIKYSLLNQSQFQIVNGSGWVLLDGKPLDENSDLYKLIQSTGSGNIISDGKLPNADGVFIRIDTNENDDFGDPQKGRITGSFQIDDIKSHSHTGWVGANANANPDGSTDTKGGAQEGGGLDRYPVYPIPIGVNGASTETRPKNICFYTYIKINNIKQ